MDIKIEGTDQYIFIPEERRWNQLVQMPSCQLPKKGRKKDDTREED